MSDPIARPHKRLATLTGAAIAAMLSPSGKIISSAAAAGLIVAAVSTQVIDDRARVTSLPSASANAANASVPVSHVLIAGTDGKDIPVVLTENPSEERKNTPVGMDSQFQSGIPQTQLGSPTSRSAASPLVVASLPAPSSGGPLFSLPRTKTPPPSLLEPEVLDTPIVSDTPREDDPTDSEKPSEEKQADTGETPADKETAADPEPSTPETKTPVVTSIFPPRVDPASDGPGGNPAATGPVVSLAALPVAAVISEPGLLGLMLVGLGGVAWSARRRPSK